MFDKIREIWKSKACERFVDAAIAVLLVYVAVRPLYPEAGWFLWVLLVAGALFGGSLIVAAFAHFVAKRVVEARRDTENKEKRTTNIDLKGRGNAGRELHPDEAALGYMLQQDVTGEFWRIRWEGTTLIMVPEGDAPLRFDSFAIIPLLDLLAREKEVLHKDEVAEAEDTQ